MKSLLVGINAKYAHTNLAIRSLKSYANQQGIKNLSIVEFTINQHPDVIVSTLFEMQPDFIAFSCYNWNDEIVKKVLSTLRKILKNIIIVLGGPQVSYLPSEVLQQTGADIIVIGEGEVAFVSLLKSLQQKQPLKNVPSLVYQTAEGIHVTSPAPPVCMDDLSFGYEHEMKLSQLEHRLVYMETMRGCPFRCSYCLSGDKQVVRFMSLDRVFSQIDLFLQYRVKRVKFVDRTFNCHAYHAMSIWKYIVQQDNQYTNFHFEIAADLLNETMIDFLKTVRSGLFQFEIGVQSSNPDTLSAIRRYHDFSKIQQSVKVLRSYNHLHLHLDLIAGLPLESYEQFSHSFDQVMALKPHQLQLGFLKVLPGSHLKKQQKQYNIVHRDDPPYEVLSTHDISYRQLCRLHIIADMVDLYYNSGRFNQLIEYVSSLFKSSFSFFEALADYYKQQSYHLRPHTALAYYTILYEFFQSLSLDLETENLFQWWALYDLYRHEKIRYLPNWLSISMASSYRKEIYDFFQKQENIEKYFKSYLPLTGKQIYRQAHIEVFPFNPLTMEQEITPILFDYKNLTLQGHATTQVVALNIKEKD